MTDNELNGMTMKCRKWGIKGFTGCFKKNRSEMGRIL
jgi:hypothetical protein